MNHPPGTSSPGATKTALWPRRRIHTYISPYCGSCAPHPTSTLLYTATENGRPISPRQLSEQQLRYLAKLLPQRLPTIYPLLALATARRLYFLIMPTAKKQEKKTPDHVCKQASKHTQTHTHKKKSMDGIFWIRTLGYTSFFATFERVPTPSRKGQTLEEKKTKKKHIRVRDGRRDYCPVSVAQTVSTTNTILPNNKSICHQPKMHVCR